MRYIFIILLIGCGSKDKFTFEGVRQEAKIVAVYQKPDTTKVLAVMLRIIEKTIKTENGKDFITYDTVWGKPTIEPMVDSSGKTVMEKGKPVFNPNPVYYRISKDSVNWRIEGQDVDSLLKKN